MQSFWKNFWALTKPYWISSEDKWMGYTLLSGIFFSIICQVRLMVILNVWRQSFYDSLQIFNMHYVLLSLSEFIIILFLAIVLFTYTSYWTGLLSIRWQKWMTHQYLGQWLQENTAYSMHMLSKKMDNPDQRISQDLNEFPALTLSLLTGLFNSILTLISFSIILWELSEPLKIALSQHHTMTLHGYMFWATAIYAGLGTWIIGKIGIHLIRLNYQQEQFNANFRFGLIRVREASEQIAIYGGQKTEENVLKSFFKPIYQNFLHILKVQKNLNFFVNGYNPLILVVGILLALPRYIHEKLGLGYLIQTGSAFENIVSALSFIVFSFSSIASLRAAIWRLTEFQQLMKEAQIDTPLKNILITDSPDDAIHIKNLKLHLPHEEHQSLTQSLNITFKKNQHALITGQYGSGKSTLLRALANIWHYGHGNIQLPKGKKLFLSQKPYFPLGTLRQALLYPETDNIEILDKKILAILDMCGLSYLKKYLHQVRFWPMELSLGEQQLVAFARIFLIKPEWVFLDEATSALDEETEKRMYRLLESTFHNISIISVGHRSTLKQFHENEIFIEKQDR